VGRKSVQDAIRDRLVGQTAKLPVSVLGRLGKTALTGARGGGLMLFRDLGAGDRELSDSDIEALTRFVQTLGQMKGIAMKFGQILSYIDLDVPEEMSRALAVLQTQSPSMPFEAVAGIVRQDLGARAEVLMKKIDHRPAAAASIGQVHRATLDDGTAVAVKVRYPDIDKAIENDFSMASFGTGMARMMFPGARLESMIEEARSRFLLECDYQHEARLQERFRNLYHGHPTIVVPPVFGEFCSTRVLTTGWMDGLSFDAWLASGPSQADRDRIGQALFEFYIGTLFQHGLYNCDPHPGNYVFLADGRVAVLDYGCTRTRITFDANNDTMTRPVASPMTFSSPARTSASGLVCPGTCAFVLSDISTRTPMSPSSRKRSMSVRCPSNGASSSLKSPVWTTRPTGV